MGTVLIDYTPTTGDVFTGYSIWVDGVKISEDGNGSFEATVGVSYYIEVA